MALLCGGSDTIIYDLSDSEYILLQERDKLVALRQQSLDLAIEKLVEAQKLQAAVLENIKAKYGPSKLRSVRIAGRKLYVTLHEEPSDLVGWVSGTSLTALGNVAVASDCCTPVFTR